MPKVKIIKFCFIRLLVAFSQYFFNLSFSLYNLPQRRGRVDVMGNSKCTLEHHNADKFVLLSILRHGIEVCSQKRRN